MSNYFYGSALDTELDYRRTSLRRQASDHQLAQQVRRAARTGRKGFHADGRRS